MSDDYYLNVLHDENNFKLIRKLSVDEYDKFNKASVFMQKLNVKLYFFRMVDYSYIELKNFEKAYKKGGFLSSYMCNAYWHFGRRLILCR